MAKANQPWGVKYDLTHITEEINFWQQKLAEADTFLDYLLIAKAAAAALEKHAQDLKGSADNYLGCLVTNTIRNTQDELWKRKKGEKKA